MTRLVVAILAGWLAAVPPSSAAGHERLGGDRIAPGSLPLVPVRIANGTDPTVSLTIPAASCRPRVILPPGASTVLAECLRWVLVYHGRAVFYTGARVLERRDFLFVARPGEDWVFARLPLGAGPPGSAAHEQDEARAE